MDFRGRGKKRERGEKKGKKKKEKVQLTEERPLITAH